MIENSVGLLKLSAFCWCRISVNLELSAGSQSKIWRIKTYCRFLKLYCSLQVKYFWQFRTAFDSPESKILRDGNILQIFLILLPEIMSMFETYCSLQVLYFSQFGTVFALKARFWGMETYCRLPKSYCRNNDHGQKFLFYLFFFFDFSIFHFKVALFRVVLHFRGGVGYKMVKKFESKLLAKKLRSQ